MPLNFNQDSISSLSFTFSGDPVYEPMCGMPCDGAFSVTCKADDWNRTVERFARPFGVTDMCVERVIFKDPATIVFWSDGSKTVVKCAQNRAFEPYYGFCCAVAKKVFGSNSAIRKALKRMSNIAEYEHGSAE